MHEEHMGFGLTPVVGHDIRIAPDTAAHLVALLEKSASAFSVVGDVDAQNQTRVAISSLSRAIERSAEEEA